MRYQRTFCFAALCATLAMAAPAWAQAPAAAPEATNAQADELTHRGVDLIKKHQWAEAEALLRQAWALKHAYDIAGNLGLAEAGLGRWREASEHLAFALETFPANGKAAHRELLREKLGKVREELGVLTIVVGTAGAEVFVDGRSVGTAPLEGAVFVEVGAHMVEARLAGYVTATQGVEAAKGGALTVTLAPVAVAVAREAPVVVAPVVRRPVWPAVVGGGLAVVGLAVGAGLTVAANGKASDADALRAKVGTNSACSGTAAGTQSCTAILSGLRSRDSLTKAAFTSLVLGGAFALAAGGLGVWAVSAPKDQKSAPHIRIAPAVGRDEGGLVVSGSF